MSLLTDGRPSHPAQALGQETPPHSCTEQRRIPLRAAPFLLEGKEGGSWSQESGEALACWGVGGHRAPAPGGRGQALSGQRECPGCLPSVWSRNGGEGGGPRVPRQSLPSLEPHICPSNCKGHCKSDTEGGREGGLWPLQGSLPCTLKRNVLGIKACLPFQFTQKSTKSCFLWAGSGAAVALPAPPSPDAHICPSAAGGPRRWGQLVEA